MESTQILLESLGWATTALVIAYFIVSLVLPRKRVLSHRIIISVFTIILDIVKMVLRISLGLNIILMIISIICWALILYWNILSLKVAENLYEDEEQDK